MVYFREVIFSDNGNLKLKETILKGRESTINRVKDLSRDLKRGEVDISRESSKLKRSTLEAKDINKFLTSNNPTDSILRNKITRLEQLQDKIQESTHKIKELDYEVRRTKSNLGNTQNILNQSGKFIDKIY